MMRSSNSKNQGKVETVNSESHLANGLSSKERLPTIQIDTVPSPPPSPDELTPPDETNEIEEPIDESDIQLDLDATQQETGNSSEDLKERLQSYVEDILSQAMVIAEKKIQFAGLPEDDEDEEELQSEPAHRSSEPAQEPEAEPEIDESEIRATAEKVVQEVITKASETVAEKLENEVADLTFPGLPSIQIDTAAPVPSPPPSPECKEEIRRPIKKWTFKIEDSFDSESEKKVAPDEPTMGLPSIQIDTVPTVPSPPPSPESKDETRRPFKKWTFKIEDSIDLESEKKVEPEKPTMIKFEEAPEDVKEVASSFVKDIVGKAITMAEEKSVPTVPFNFEDVELMKTSGPWYIRAREALIRLLRTACFCTPRRTDS